MNVKNLISNSFFLLAVCFTALFFHSCSKNDVTDAPINTSIDEEFGKHLKELTIFDEANENSAVLLVGSDDASILNMWTAENFTLVPVKEGETTKEAVDAFFAKNAPIANDEAEVDEDALEDTGASISTKLLSTSLVDGVAKVVLHSTSPYDEDMRGWTYQTHYSDYQGQAGENTGTVTCNVYGQNFWHRGYYGIQYKKYSSSSWSTVVSEWKQIKRGDTDEYSKTPCYVMKARRKYKGSNNNSVLVEFEY